MWGSTIWTAPSRSTAPPRSWVSARSYLSRIFSEVDGKRFTQYLSDLRIEQAKRLLADESKLVRDVGQEVGFLTVQNFMRVFKSKTGVTPSEYRSTLPRKS